MRILNANGPIPPNAWSRLLGQRQIGRRQTDYIGASLSCNSAEQVTDASQGASRELRGDANRPFVDIERLVGEFGLEADGLGVDDAERGLTGHVERRRDQVIGRSGVGVDVESRVDLKGNDDLVFIDVGAVDRCYPHMVSRAPEMIAA